ncbi:MAG: transporter associated domain-containing protein, partial [Dehalococcoidia bacterium]
GMLYVRDLLRRWPLPAAGGFDLARVMREAVFVPDSVRIDDLLNRMRRGRVQIVVVMDEYSGTAGIVTMEDVLERIVGEVRDEFEPGSAEVEVLPEGDAVIDGLVLVSDLNERFNLDLDEDLADTIGGFVFSQLGRIAEVGDEVALQGLCLRVEQMDGHRVAQVRLTRTKPAAASGATDEEVGSS